MGAINAQLLIELVATVATSWLIWLFYAWRYRNLRVRVLDHTGVYTFMIAIDIAMIVKRPSLTLVQLGHRLEPQQGTRVFIFLAIAAFIAGFLGAWLDAKAERVLVPYLQPQKNEEKTALERWLALSRITATWHFWRSCQRVIISVLGALHTIALVMVSGVTN